MTLYHTRSNEQEPLWREGQYLSRASVLAGKSQEPFRGVVSVGPRAKRHVHMYLFLLLMKMSGGGSSFPRAGLSSWGR